MGTCPKVSQTAQTNQEARMKIITVVGARPQFIKAAAVSRAFRNYPDIQELIVHTGQHFDHNMSDVFFKEMDIPHPHYNLQVQGLSHAAMTGQMMEKLEAVLEKEKPDAVMVYGDTNSTLAGALTAKKMHIKVIHVEAGLRSHNMRMPEEVNRILTDRISDILFVPTQHAMDILKQEGFENFDCKIFLSGDVMEDSAIHYAKKAAAESTILQQLGLQQNKYCLATIHRQENTDEPGRLLNIIEALNEINNHMPVVLPLHPRTRKKLKTLHIEPAFAIIDPVGYLDMMQLLQHTRLVITDSGGLQKESFFFSKFCIILREQSEWVELLEYGYNFLASSEKEKIVGTFHILADRKFEKQHNFYGGGTASEYIAGTLHQLQLK